MTYLVPLLTSTAAAAAAEVTENNFHSKAGKSCFACFSNTAAPTNTPAVFVSNFLEFTHVEAAPSSVKSLLLCLFALCTQLMIAPRALCYCSLSIAVTGPMTDDH